MLDQEKADRAVRFIKTLKHTQGDWAGKPFNLLKWEEDIIRDIFGTVNEDGTRQYRKAYISVARKNGKTELCGAIANYMLYADAEEGAEIYAAAADRDQAGKLFSASKIMVEKSPSLLKVSKIIESTKRIVYPKRNSFFRAISSEAYTKHGYNPSAVFADELHIWPKRELWDVLETGMGARKQPLMIAITTAGWDRNSLCFELYEYAKKIISGSIENPTFYAKIYEVEKDEDWKDEKNWYKANPGLGIYRELKEMRDMFLKACQMPSFENSFRNLYLNQWTQQAVKAINMDLWAENGIGSRPEEELLGQVCFGGLDLASVSDFIAWVLVFPRSDDFEEIDILARFWCPEAWANSPHNRYKDQYQLWARQGFLTITPGDATDYGFVKKCIVEDARRFNLVDLNVDRLFQGQQLSAELADEGLKVVAMGQGFLSMIAPCTEFERRLLMKKIHHGYNPVLTFCIDNLMWVEGPAGHKPSKQESQGKIDGAVALIMAIDRASRNGTGTSIYDTRGLLQI